MSAQTRAQVFKDTRTIGSKTDTDKIEVLEFTCKSREDAEVLPKATRSLARVYNADPLDVARECAQTGYNVAMLVEINENFPVSGMVKGGMQGQESEVLLRSNYCRRINDNYYPLKRRQLTYAANMVVHKDKVYELYQKSFNVGMIGTTIVRRPTLHSKQENGSSVQSYANRSEEELMRDTVNSVFSLAKAKGYDTLVLPAIGCEQGHPIDAVIGFFNEAMTRYDIKYVFYAIKSYVDYKPRCGMFLTFHKGIERKYVPSRLPPAAKATTKAAPKAPKEERKAMSKVERELQDDAIADAAENLEAELIADTAEAVEDDLTWLEDLADEVSTEQAAAQKAPKPVEPVVAAKTVDKKKKTKKKVTLSADA